ncbi:hypothetical protein MIND_00806700 [Mycena indigotica]|uniref:Uncharacterized protein n=1 Tax=Mycena indigotica TaxID=2126181 RepID=A0A8H6SGR4_9AGAR|nr:uncharacterized protein MIND_00806700 [Mycena indigotica]KAF7298597.1 hypothetical protein MIND_00806700 [Mycena indigotica]
MDRDRDNPGRESPSSSRKRQKRSPSRGVSAEPALANPPPPAVTVQPVSENEYRLAAQLADSRREAEALRRELDAVRKKADRLQALVHSPQSSHSNEAAYRERLARAEAALQEAERKRRHVETHWIHAERNLSVIHAQAAQSRATFGQFLEEMTTGIDPRPLSSGVSQRFPPSRPSSAAGYVATHHQRGLSDEEENQDQSRYKRQRSASHHETRRRSPPPPLPTLPPFRHLQRPPGPPMPFPSPPLATHYIPPQETIPPIRSPSSTRSSHTYPSRPSLPQIYSPVEPEAGTSRRSRTPTQSASFPRHSSQSPTNSRYPPIRPALPPTTIPIPPAASELQIIHDRSPPPPPPIMRPSSPYGQLDSQTVPHTTAGVPASGNYQHRFQAQVPIGSAYGRRESGEPGFGGYYARGEGGPGRKPTVKLGTYETVIFSLGDEQVPRYPGQMQASTSLEAMQPGTGSVIGRGSLSRPGPSRLRRRSRSRSREGSPGPEPEEEQRGARSQRR